MAPAPRTATLHAMDSATESSWAPWWAYVAPIGAANFARSQWLDDDWSAATQAASLAVTIAVGVLLVTLLYRLLR